MIDIIADTILHMFHYCSSCACHQSADEYHKWVCNVCSDAVITKAACPMAGRLLPYACTGVVRKKLNNLWVSSETTLMLKVCQGLSEAGRGAGRAMRGGSIRIIRLLCHAVDRSPPQKPFRRTFFVILACLLANLPHPPLSPSSVSFSSPSLFLLILTSSPNEPRHLAPPI